MTLIDLKSMADLEKYLDARKLRMFVTGCDSTIFVEMARNGTQAALGAGPDFADALKAALTDYELREAMS